jgi:hypothetical protein
MTRFILVAALIVAGLAGPRTVAAQAPAGWLGTWTLNVGKSSYNPGPPPYRRGSFVVEPAGDGVRIVSRLIRARGGVVHTEWTGRFDGKDYPVQGIDEVLSYAYLPIDERTWELVIKADGRTIGKSRATMSADGRTLTTVTAARDPRGNDITTTTVYEKR